MICTPFMPDIHIHASSFQACLESLFYEQFSLFVQAQNCHVICIRFGIFYHCALDIESRKFHPEIL
jgi:hypothetical protein